MEVEKYTSSTMSKEEEDEDDVELPGFRFHPTDEELVGFYLRRKVEKRPIRLNLIKLVDIYKFDPWDLPRDKEWYFFCRRGRKYKNSVRPNRVTRSGFWKATGIDRPIYSTSGRECIGLKKSLVYYRGSAGKGTKTDWMMHEFRLPTGTAHDKSTKHIIPQEPAEVWTLCRILKRNVSYPSEWREMNSKRQLQPPNNNYNNNNIPPPVIIDASSQTCSVESCDQNRQSSSSYISFMRTPLMKTSPLQQQTQTHESLSININNQHHHRDELPSVASSYVYGDINDFLRYADWEDLRSVVDCAAAANPFNSHQYY